PARTPVHRCYLLEEAQATCCGDLMAGSGTVVVGSGEGDLINYLASLRRLLGLAPSRVLPGHGPAIEDPAAKIQEYLDHRQLREDQILSALDSGPRSIPELRESIYPEVPTALHRAAENNVRTHLLKLRSERRAVETGDRWTKR